MRTEVDADVPNRPGSEPRLSLSQKIIGWSAHNKFLVLLLTVFAIVAAVHSLRSIPLDAIPDLSDTQVIIYSKWDRSPDILEDQVTYPIVSALLGAPKVKAIRGFSDFGFSYVYVIFEDGTDIYWARSRVLEYLSKITPNLPKGVSTELGPDATGVGWVFQYALVDKSGKQSLQTLRSFQDWTLKYYMQSVPGVAEVASLGGFVKQYQITVDPVRLKNHGLSMMEVAAAIRKGNQETGGRLVEFSGAEYMVRGRGYARTVEDLEKIVVGMSHEGIPILVKHVARVAIGPEIRRGIADLDGEGDTVTGTVVMRFGENALQVIERVKKKIEEVKPSFPEGVELVVTYDRSTLILRAIDTLKEKLLEEMIVVSIVILIFLWHFPSAVVPILTIPVSVLLAFIPMQLMGLSSNIMSLSGIAISIGVLVDGAIVEVENAYKRIEEWIAGGKKGDFHDVRLKSLQEVGPTVFFSLLVVSVSFLPIFTLLDQEGRLFKPLAWSKTLAMALAAMLALTLDPALRMLFTRVEPFRFKPKVLSKPFSALLVGTYRPEEKHPVSRALFFVYEPVCRWVLRHRKTTIALAVAAMIGTVPVYFKLGNEFMPPLWEGDLLYMPTTLPGISVGSAADLLQTQDRIIKQFPEVDRVFGKAGRIESSTDPAPFSMMETVVLLKPESEWRSGMTREKLIDELDQALKIPGTTNAWTLPIKNRIDMLSTGVRTPVGIKVLGKDLKTIETIGLEVEAAVRDVPGTRSAFAERAAGGYFLDVDLDRDKLARYGLSVSEVQDTIAAAVGGENVTEIIDGRERYSVNVRYPREFRGDPDQISRVTVRTMDGRELPVSYFAKVKFENGPAMIRNENGMLAGYVYVDVSGRDIGSFVDDAKEAVRAKVRLPEGYALLWSGQYENMIRVRERLKIVVPLTLVIIMLLLYFNMKSWVKTWIVMLAVPFSLIGAVWMLYFLDYNVSIAVWVGMIALMGLDAETGVFMLLYLDLSIDRARREGKLSTQRELEAAIMHGAVRRIRPKMMTVLAAMLGLLPILWGHGAGSDLMKRVAAPMVGGLATSFILELLVYPAIYSLWKSRELHVKKVPSISTTGGGK